MDKPFQGKLDILRMLGASDNTVRLRVEDTASGTRVVEIDVDVTVFALALMGLARQDCVFEVSTDLVGCKREHKRELVRVPDTSYGPKRDRKARAACRKFEVDGWRPNLSDLKNPHRIRQGEKPDRTGETYEVLFERWLKPDGTPVVLPAPEFVG